MNARRYRFLAVAFSLLQVGVLAAAQPAPKADARGGVVQVVQDGPAIVLQRFQDGALQWSRTLPAMPSFVQLGAEGVSVAGSIRFDGKAGSWARVVSSDGSSWDVPGDPRRVHLSADGSRLLVQSRSGEEVETKVYDRSGMLLVTLPVEGAAPASVELSRAGDAVLIAPGGDASEVTLSLFDLDSGVTWSVEMPGDEEADQAVAIDSSHLVTLGNGTLRYHDLEQEGRSWGRHPSPAYSTLLGVSDEGHRILVSRRGGYDLLDESGRGVWSFDPLASGSALRSGLASIDDLRQLQVELLATGDVLLRDRSSNRRFILRAAGGSHQHLQVVPNGSLIDPAGRVVPPVG